MSAFEMLSPFTPGPLTPGPFTPGLSACPLTPGPFTPGASEYPFTPGPLTPGKCLSVLLASVGVEGSRFKVVIAVCPPGVTVHVASEMSFGLLHVTSAALNRAEPVALGLLTVTTRVVLEYGKRTARMESTALF